MDKTPLKVIYADKEIDVNANADEKIV